MTLFCTRLLDSREREYVYLSLASDKAQATQQVEDYHKYLRSSTGIYSISEPEPIEITGSLQGFSLGNGEIALTSLIYEEGD